MRLIGHFPYSRIQNGIYRPLLPITAINGHDREKSIELMCLLDTGADHSMLPGYLCEHLGHDLNEGTHSIRLKGIAGSLHGHLHTNMIRVKNELVKCDFYFCRDWNAGFGILGHSTFFSQFSAFFNTRQGYFSIYR